MSDLEFLFLILWAFYLGECMFWVRTGMFVFSSQLGERRRRSNLRWAFFRNPDGGVLFGNLLPSGEASICQQWPLSISPEGVFAFVSAAPSSDGRPLYPQKFILFEDIERIEAHGAVLTINGAVFAQASSTDFARYLAVHLRRLKTLPAVERGPAIEALLEAQFDTAALAARCDLFQRRTHDLRLTSWMIFFVVYVLTIVVSVLRPPTLFFPLVLGYFALLLLAALQFRQAHMALYPEEKWQRRKHLLMMCLSPADAVHSRDKLARGLLGPFHPLAVARVLGWPGSFEDFAAHVWRDLEHPMLPVCPAPDAAPRDTEAWFRHRFRATVERFLKRQNAPLESWLAAPPPDSKDSQSYCPRCLGQYVFAEGCCEDCGGRPVVPLRGAEQMGRSA